MPQDRPVGGMVIGAVAIAGLAQIWYGLGAFAGGSQDKARMDDQLISPNRSVGVLAASGWAAVVTIVVTVVAARSLDSSSYTHFLVYWSVLFGCFQILTGLQNEGVRAVSSVSVKPDEVPARPTARVLAMTLILAGIVAVLVLAIAPWWAPHLSVGVVVVVVSAIVVVSYGCHLTLGGILAGRRQWGTMAALSAAEPTVRIILIAGVALLAPSLSALQLAAALPALTWLLFALVVPRGRSAALARGDVALKALLANGAWAMLAAAASAVLVNGFPAIVQAALGNNTPGMASLLLGVQLTRAPLMMPLAAFQGVAIAGFVASRNGRLRALAKPFAAVVGVSAVLAVAAALLGPWIMRLLYGQQYVLSRLVLGGLTFAAMSIALLTLAGSAAIAIAAHKAFLAGWLVGAAATVGLLFALPMAGAERVIVAILVGPLVGVVVHLLAIRSDDRQHSLEADGAVAQVG